MHSHRWLWILGGILLTLAFILLGPAALVIDSLVKTDSFRHEVESQASQAAGGTVEIQQISFGFIRGIQLSGLVSKIATPQGTVTSQVESVNCSISYPALLQRRIQFGAVTLVEPQIILTQQPPSTVATPKAASTSGASASTSSSAPPPLQVVLDRAKISDGSLSIRDATGASKADLKGIEVNADTSGYVDRKDVTAQVTVGTVALPQNLNLTNLTMPVVYQAGAVQVNPIAADAFGGKLTGDYNLPLGGAASLLEINGSDIDMEKIGRAANPNSSTVFSGSLALQSKWHGVETGKLTGAGDAQITHGKLSGVSALHEAASLLGAKGLSDPDLTSVTVHFEVANGSTHFSGLHISSPDFDITGEGTIDAQSHVDASLSLDLHGAAMGGVAGKAMAFVSKVPGGAIPLHITGTVSDPHTNLSSSILNPTPKVEHALDRAVSKFFR